MKFKIIIISLIGIILLLCICISVAIIVNKVNDNNEPEIQSSFEHIKLAEIDSLNWNEVNMLSDYFQGKHYEVFRDGYVYSYESYNLSGKKNEKNFKISTEDIAKIEKILKSNIDKPRDNSGSDGTGWTFKYYDIEGNIVGKYTGYIYQYKEFNNMLELLKK